MYEQLSRQIVLSEVLVTREIVASAHENNRDLLEVLLVSALISYEEDT